MLKRDNLFLKEKKVHYKMQGAGKDEAVAMFNAVNARNYHLIRFLLRHGCDPNIVLMTSSGHCGLTMAAIKGHTDIVDLFIDFKVSLDFKDNLGMTAAMHACTHQKENVLSILVLSGADLTLSDNNGKTAFHHAAEGGALACLKILMRHQNAGSSLQQVDLAGRSVVMFATWAHSTSCLEFLLDQDRVDLDHADNDGNSPLFTAIHLGKSDHVRLLLEKGARLNTVNAKGQTALSKAFEQIPGWYMFKILSMLLSYGERPIFTSYDEQHLHEMIACGEKKLVQLMLSIGFSPRLRKCRKSVFRFEITTKISPLAVALLSNEVAIARYLLANLFLTPFDVTDLPNSSEIAAHLIDNDFYESYSILRAMSQNPFPLYMLTFVSVLDLASNKRCENQIQSQKFILPQLPNLLQQKLLFKTELASLCIDKWETIPLMFESGYLFPVTQPLSSVWPIGHWLVPCQCTSCSKSKEKGYKILGFISTTIES